MNKKAYLASPFFTEKELVFYHKVIDFLRNEEGFDLYVPMEHTIEGAWDMTNAAWAKAVFDEDIKAIDEAEYVFVINFGMYSDSGTAWEAGYAYAKGKKVVMIAPNFHAKKDYSLMMMNACCYAFDPITKKEINLDVFMQKKGGKKMEKYKVHLIDLDGHSEVIKRLVINEDQKKIFKLLIENELLPEWLKVEILPNDIPYTDLT